jgi:hypothetical protein
MHGALPPRPLCAFVAWCLGTEAIVTLSGKVEMIELSSKNWQHRGEAGWRKGIPWLMRQLPLET